MEWTTMTRTKRLTAMTLASAFLALAAGLTVAATGPGAPGEAAVAPAAMALAPDDSGYLWAIADSRASRYSWSSSEGWDGRTRLGPPTEWRPRSEVGSLWGAFE